MRAQKKKKVRRAAEGKKQKKAGRDGLPFWSGHL